jgi:hypothetical protein
MTPSTSLLTWSSARLSARPVRSGSPAAEAASAALSPSTSPVPTSGSSASSRYAVHASQRSTKSSHCCVSDSGWLDTCSISRSAVRSFHADDVSSCSRVPGSVAPAARCTSRWLCTWTVRSSASEPCRSSVSSRTVSRWSPARCRASAPLPPTTANVIPISTSDVAIFTPTGRSQNQPPLVRAAEAAGVVEVVGADAVFMRSPEPCSTRSRRAPRRSSRR